MIWQVILVQMIFFIGLVLVLRQILISSSINETRRLQQLSQENAQKTQELASRISDAENEYRDKMKQAEQEIRDLKAAAKREAQDLKESLVAQAKAEGERIVAQALGSRDEIRREIEGALAARSLALARKIFEQVFSSGERRMLFDGLWDEILKDLAGMGDERLRAIDLGDGSPKEIGVECSHPLSAGQKMELEKMLSEKFGRAIVLRETVDPRVMVGIVLRAGSFVIDGSLSDRFQRAAEVA